MIFEEMYYGTVPLLRFYIGDTKMWEKPTITHLNPVDPAKIAVILLDANGEPTDDVTYVDTHAEARSIMNNSSEGSRYWIKMGDQCTENLGGQAYGTYGTPQDRLQRFTVGPFVNSIGNSAFQYCTSLKQVDFTSREGQPSSANISYGTYVFAYCESLDIIDMSGPLCGNITNEMFFAGGPLTGLILPTTQTKIPDSAFAYNRVIKTIDLPSTITTIVSNAFGGCTSLKSITIHKPENSISGAPWNAPDTTNVIWLDESKVSVILLDEDDDRISLAFASDDYDQSPAGVMAYLANREHTGPYEIYYGKDWVTSKSGSISTGVHAASIHIVTLPSTLVMLGSGWASGCTNLKKCILTNTSLSGIQTACFNQCTNLVDIGTIPSTATSFSSGSFSQCTSLGTVEFADEGDAIELPLNVFYQCNIQTIYLPSRVTALNSGAFTGSTIQNLIINKPEDSIEGYPWGASSIGTITWTGTA